jgi:hypothetical protein
LQSILSDPGWITFNKSNKIVPLNDSRPALLPRIGLGASAQTFYQAVQMAIRLAEIPLFISIWGVNLYGEWLILAALPTYVAMGDLGFVSASVKEMSIRSSAGNQQGALSVFQSTWLWLCMISFIVFFVIASSADAIPIGEWFGFVIINPRDLKVVVILLTGHALLTLHGGLFSGGFWCTGRYPLSIFWSAIANALEFTGLAIAVTIGGGPDWAAGGYFCGRLAGNSYDCNPSASVNSLVALRLFQRIRHRHKKIVGPSCVRVSLSRRQCT